MEQIIYNFTILNSASALGRSLGRTGQWAHGCLIQVTNLGQEKDQVVIDWWRWLAVINADGNPTTRNA